MTGLPSAREEPGEAVARDGGSPSRPGPTADRAPRAERARRGVVALWLPPILYLGAIFWLSSESSPLLSPPSFPGSDKLAHFGAYAMLGLLLCRAFAGSGLSPAAALALAIITASLYGASDEWHQSFVPHRMADATDWVADMLGAAVGASLRVWLVALRGRRSPASIR